MTDEQKIRYNRNSAVQRGWSPSWLDANDFDDDLIKKIIQFQNEFDLDEDGLVGPSTYRRLFTQFMGDRSDEPVYVQAKEKSSIRYRGKDFPIMWSKVVLWDDPGGLECRSRISGRRPKYFVNHWDVCLNSKTCAKVLAKRNLGVHFCIDNDGTIYQLAPMENICYHAKKHNQKSIGVEISNAYSLKYQEWYRKNGYGKRPVITEGHVHGKSLKPFLGFYPHQIQALAALWAAVSCATGIPLKVPNKNNEVDHYAASGSFEGFVGHYHLTRRKIDPAGIDFHQVMDMAILIKLQMEG